MTSFVELREGNLKTAVFTFGRFNPPTIGHEVLIDKIETVAKRNRADAFVFVSASQDSKKNPLDYKDKIKWMKKMFKVRGQNIFKYSREQPENIMKIASLLHDNGYEQIVMVVGSDRINEFKKLMSQYNGVKDKPHGFYDFKNIDIESAGERDPDADDATGMSASKLRDLAVDSDFETFKTGLPDTLSDRDKRNLYQLVRKQMKLSVMENQKNMKFKKKNIKVPSKKQSAAAQDKFLSNVTASRPKEKPIKYDDDETAFKKASAALGFGESLYMEKIEFEGDSYDIDSRAVKIFEYIKTLPYNSKEITYIKGCLKECEGFFENYTLITKKIRLWEISKLREFIKRTNDYIMILDENSGMIDFNKTDFTYLHEMIDNLPKDESNLQDPVSNKLQNLLGLKEWNKNRDKEGQQLEFGTDKYRQYTVDLTPGEEFKQEQEKERLQQSERYNKILSKILASRSK